jgi:hypothetical protein
MVAGMTHGHLFQAIPTAGLETADGTLRSRLARGRRSPALLLAALMSAACASTVSTDHDAQRLPEGGDATADSGSPHADASDRPEADRDIPPITPLSEFPARFTASVCDGLFRCAPRDDREVLLRALLGDRTGCVASLGTGHNPVVTDLVRAVAMGIVTYQGDAASLCLERLSTTCGPLFQTALVCPEAFTGTVAPGQGCSTSFDCVPSAWCDHGSGCPGTCRPRVGTGQSCRGSDVECEQVPYGMPRACKRGSAGSATCVEVATGTSAGEGQTCGTVVSSTTAATTTRCREGLWCQTSEGSAGICRPAIADGSPCTSAGAVCSSGAACLPTGVGAALSCQRIILQSAVGSRCSTNGPEVCDIRQSLACVAGTCRTTAGSARACDARSVLACGSDQGCDPTSMSCGSLREAGASCAHSLQCVSGDCDLLNGTCRARLCL